MYILILGRKQCNTSMLLSNEKKGGVKQSIARVGGGKHASLIKKWKSEVMKNDEKVLVKMERMHLDCSHTERYKICYPSCA